MIINIRGTSGSGKTFVVRGLMAKGIAHPIGDNAKKPDAYHVDIPTLTRPLFIVGSYENVCGGCDGIATQDEICSRVRTLAPLGHVIMEGLLMSHTFARYATLDREMAALDIPSIWAFLDTPLEVCLNRVRARREERRLAKPDPPAFKELDVTNTSDKWHSNRATYEKFVKGRESDWKQVKGYKIAKLDARWVPYLTATETIFSWLT